MHLTAFNFGGSRQFSRNRITEWAIDTAFEAWLSETKVKVIVIKFPYCYGYLLQHDNATIITIKYRNDSI